MMKSSGIAAAAEAEVARKALADEAARLEAIPPSTAVQEAAEAILKATEARDALALSVQLGEGDAEALKAAEKVLDDARLRYVSESSKADLGRAARVRLDAVEARLGEARKGSALATIGARVELQGEAAVRYRRAADALRTEALRMRALAGLVRGQEAAAGLRFGKTPDPIDLDGAHLPATRWCGAQRGENLLLLRDFEVQATRESLKAELAAAGLPV